MKKAKLAIFVSGTFVFGGIGYILDGSSGLFAGLMGYLIGWGLGQIV